MPRATDPKTRTLRTEQQIVAVQAALGGVRLQLGGDLGADLEAPVLLVFGVGLHQEAAVTGVKLGWTCRTARLTVSIRVAKSKSRTRSSVSSP